MEISEAESNRNLKETYREIEEKAIAVIKKGEAVDNPILTKEKRDPRYSIAVIAMTNGEIDTFLGTASKELQEVEPDIRLVPDGFRHINLREVSFKPEGRRAAKIDTEIVKEYYKTIREEFLEPGKPLQLRLVRVLPAIDKEQNSVSVVGAFLPLNARISDVRTQINQAIENTGLPLVGRLGNIQVIFSTLGRLPHPPRKEGERIPLPEKLNEINAVIPEKCEMIINRIDMLSTTPISYVDVSKHVYIWPPISLTGQQSQDPVRYLRPKERLKR